MSVILKKAWDWFLYPLYFLGELCWMEKYCLYHIQKSLWHYNDKGVNYKLHNVCCAYLM